MIEFPEQVILWNEPDGIRRSEHRSIGDMHGDMHPVGMGCEAFIRGPRSEDEVYAICCGYCSHEYWREFKSRRPAVVAVTPSRSSAEHGLTVHVAAHRLARARFDERRREAYRRQRRIEEAVA